MTPQVWNRRDRNVPPGAIYVGRPTKWGNPHNIGRCNRCQESHTREEALRLYEASFPQGFSDAVRAELHGLDLICWCAPLPCHADVLLKIANE